MPLPLWGWGTTNPISVRSVSTTTQSPSPIIPTVQILGIDYGRKRIGIAHGDDDTRIAFALTTIAGRNDVTRDARAVADLCGEHGAATVVIGLPLNMDGTEGEQATLTRDFAAELERLSTCRVIWQDERLSTQAAHSDLDDIGLSGKKRKAQLDALAARQILQAYFDSLE